jgi:hypothetical protein
MPTYIVQASDPTGRSLVFFSSPEPLTEWHRLVARATKGESSFIPSTIRRVGPHKWTLRLLLQPEPEEEQFAFDRIIRKLKPYYNIKLKNPEISTKTRDRKYIKTHQHDKLKKEYTIVSPKGETVTFTGYKEFCSENGLNEGGLWKVLLGKRNHHKGWTKPKG